jgi:hypothetical protein
MEATTQRKAWRSIAQKWNPEVAKRSNIGAIMRSNYEKTLGAFEAWLTTGVPTKVSHFKAAAPGPVAGAAAAARTAAALAAARPARPLPPTGEQRRALLQQDSRGVAASSAAAGSTNAGSSAQPGESVLCGSAGTNAQRASQAWCGLELQGSTVHGLVCTRFRVQRPILAIAEAVQWQPRYDIGARIPGWMWQAAWTWTNQQVHVSWFTTPYPTLPVPPPPPAVLLTCCSGGAPPPLCTSPCPPGSQECAGGAAAAAASGRSGLGHAPGAGEAGGHGAHAGGGAAGGGRQTVLP